MLIRLGRFYASLLVLICLGINIAFFPEVREPFLGSDDPLASVKSALSELDIQARIAEFYPQIQSKTEDIQDTPAPPTPKKQEKPAGTTSELPAKTSAPEPTTSDPLLDLSLWSVPSPKAESKSTPKETEAPKPTPSVAVSKDNQQTAATMSAPKAAAAVIMPVVADQFKPTTTAPKPTETAKPSANAVWDTIDTVLERPIRYDR